MSSLRAGRYQQLCVHWRCLQRLSSCLCTPSLTMSGMKALLEPDASTLITGPDIMFEKVICVVHYYVWLLYVWQV